MFPLGACVFQIPRQWLQFCHVEMGPFKQEPDSFSGSVAFSSAVTSTMMSMAWFLRLVSLANTSCCLPVCAWNLTFESPMDYNK